MKILGGGYMMIGSSDETVRVDLHLHSRASGLGDDGDVRESYTLPEESYRMAKRAGMDFVTLTDHETIDGSLTLLHHPDFLVGEEVSARFPEDGGYADILLYGLDAGSHVEAQDRRNNIYDLVLSPTPRATKGWTSPRLPMVRIVMFMDDSSLLLMAASYFARPLAAP
jgi:hypothetical protein